MIILRCTNDNGVVQDIQVQDQIDLRLDVSAIENASIGDVYGISSQDFSIVGNNEVNAFFGNLYNLGATAAVALQNSIPCQVLLDGAEVFKGKLYIKDIITDPEGFNSIYNVIVVNEVVDFKFELQDKYLAEFDFTPYNHNYTYANISQSWGGNLLSGSIVYPFVNYGKPENDPTAPDYAFAAVFSTGSNTIDNYNSPLRLIDFKPAMKAKNIVDVIFSGSSYEYTSSFFNSSYFNSLYVLATPDDTLGVTNVSPVSQSAWAYISSSVQTILANTQTQVDFDAEIIDNGNNFNLATDRYTADTDGTYTYQTNISFTVGNWGGFVSTDRVQLILRKNGGSIVNSTTVLGPPESGSAFLQGAVSLNAGDYIVVEISFSTLSGTRFLTLRNDQGQPSYYPNGYLSYFQIKGAPSVLGGNVDMGEQFPDDLKALDFLQGLIEKFNLVVEPVPNSRNLIRIEPYQDWIDSGAQRDWTNKVDRNERFAISHPILEQPRTIIFKDEDDDDVLNKYTVDNIGRTFGSYTFTSDSDLAEGERVIGKVFAATPVTGIPNGRQFVVPHLCTITDNNSFRPMQFKPRLLFNNGLQTVPQTALGISGSATTRGTIYIRDENAVVQPTTVWNQMSTLTAIPVNYNTGQDLHFNNDLYSQYFQASANGKVKADAYRSYWATYINGLYDLDARKLTCNVYLKPTEIQNIALNDRIFIDGAYYRINRINGANLSRRDTVEVELIKVLANQLKFPRRISNGLNITLDYNSLSIDGTGRYINLDTGGYVDNYQTVLGPGIKDGFKVFNNAGTASVVWDYQQPIDNTNQFDQQILGTNLVDIGASKVNTLGNNNEVKGSTETAFIIGSENFVDENVSNATVIGQSHVIDQTSTNVQLLGGVANSASGSNNNLVIVGGTGSYAENTDYSAIINSYNAALRDSDVTTLIGAQENEVVINGSGHNVIGLNLEGAGLDLLDYRSNSNWLGDTYLGEAIFRERYQLECGVGNISLTGSLPGQGRHENLYILNWSGLSPATMSIELPNAVNNDYKKIVYQFQTNGTFDGTTQVNFVGFSGQTINGQSSYSISDAYSGVTFTTSGSGWIVLAGAEAQASYLSAYNSSSISPAANVSASVQLPSIDLAQNISIVSGSRITFDKAGVYDIQFSAQTVKTSGTNTQVLIWIKKNGNDVPWTNTEAIIQGNANDEIVLAWNWYVEAQTGDYYEIAYVADQNNLTFQAKTGVTGPDIPSFIVTVGSIGGGNTTISGSGGGTIDVQEDGTPIVNNATILNFTGSGVNVTSGGGSTAVIEITGGGGSAFPYTGSAAITGSLQVTGSIYFTEVIANPDTVTTPFATKTGFNSLLVGPIFNSSSITVVSGSVLKII